MNGKKKLMYLIENYKVGNYSADDFCSIFTNTFNHEIDDNDFTDDEWEQYEQLMRITSRYSPYAEDFIKSPKAYNGLIEVNEAVNKLCESLEL